jgi:hypothetical protein
MQEDGVMAALVAPLTPTEPSAGAPDTRLTPVSRFQYCNKAWGVCTGGRKHVCSRTYGHPSGHICHCGEAG